MIPTWRERLPSGPLSLVLNEQVIAMQAELADYKAALATARADERERRAGRILHYAQHGHGLDSRETTLLETAAALIQALKDVP